MLTNPVSTEPVIKWPLAAGLDLTDLFRQDEIDDLLADDEAAKLVNATVDGGGSASTGRQSGDRLLQVKVVLYVDELPTFERALRATKIDNRGQALIAISRFYLDNRPAPEVPST